MAERIVWTHQALDDLEAVCLFIQRDAPRQAQLFAGRVYEAVELLSLFPRSGRIIPEFGIPDYREVLIGNYRLLYRVGEEEIFVLGIHHTSRPLRQLP